MVCKNIVALKVYNYKLKNQILQPQSEYNKHEVLVLVLFNMSSDLQLHITIILKQKKERKARESKRKRSQFSKNKISATFSNISLSASKPISETEIR